MNVIAIFGMQHGNSAAQRYTGTLCLSVIGPVLIDSYGFSRNSIAVQLDNGPDLLYCPECSDSEESAALTLGYP